MSQSWLRDLEERVHAASKALRALREENDSLKARIKDLEQRLDSQDGGADGWQKERDEIRGRVEKLADHLAELLGDG